MRARDVRAIGFCLVSTLVLLVGSWVILGSLMISLALAAAWAAWAFTRPRMLRVYRRLGGEPDWSGYIDNEGTRLQAKSGQGQVKPGPGTVARLRRPVEPPAVEPSAEPR